MLHIPCIYFPVNLGFGFHRFPYLFCLWKFSLKSFRVNTDVSVQFGCDGKRVFFHQLFGRRHSCHADHNLTDSCLFFQISQRFLITFQQFPKTFFKEIRSPKGVDAEQDVKVPCIFPASDLYGLSQILRDALKCPLIDTAGNQIHLFHV